MSVSMRVAKGKSIGLIGVGNIGASILQGLLAADSTGRAIFISDEKQEKLSDFESEPGIEICASNEAVAKKAGILILAVKPNDMQSVVESIAPFMDEETLLISVAAGVPTSVIETYLGAERKVVRVMPNIGARVGESVTALCGGIYASEEDERIVKGILSAIGAVHIVKERDMDVITGLSGSGIAFFAAVIDAMADGGVYAGLPRDLALAISARTALGAAKLILAGDKPSTVEQITASPGGTTIRGLYAMETHGVKAAMMEAVIEATKRAGEISSTVRTERSVGHR
ncbi:MAG: pyrroline-5-carboxylate reductase [Halobacteriota archaeon]